MERLKIILSVILGLISSFCDRYGLILFLVACAIVLDFITGLVKAKISGTGLDSGIARKGFWKKVALLVALFFGVYLDVFIPTAAQTIGFTMTQKLPFGMIVGCYIAVNEAISVCENLYECDPNMVPRWIAGLLRIAKKKIEQEGSEDARH